jgi:predicted nucleic acid-binding protein
VPPPYVIDTSIWIRIWQNHPPDIFVNLWAQLDGAIAAGNICCPEEVAHELERGTDELAQFLRQRAGLFAPLDDALQAAVTEVQTACDDLADDEGERNRADPFVVALGRMRNGTVVTGEHPRRDPKGRRKIPDACAELHVPCQNWFDFLREVGWQL